MKLLLKPWIRWTAWFMFATLFALACFVLASWQLDRRSEAVSKIERVAGNYDRTAVEILELTLLAQENIIEFEWRPVNLVGQYLPDKTLLVRNRAVAGQPGFVQLIPFRLVSGELILIERGWIQADSNLDPAASFLPSSNEKQLIARVRLGELGPNRNSPYGQLTSINLPEIESVLGQELETNFYLRLDSEIVPEISNPQPLSRPMLDEGNHLSYAVQWIIFAIMGFFALFWAIRQEQEFRRMERDPEYIPRASRNSENIDSAVEDEILNRAN